MNKNEFELQKLVVQSGNFSQVITFLKHLCTVGAIVFCIYLVMQGLVIIAKNSPESLRELALVIEKLNVSTWLAHLATVGAGTGWYLERRGKKRAYKKLGDRRAQKEGDDPYHPSSELDDAGHTPN